MTKEREQECEVGQDYSMEDHRLRDIRYDIREAEIKFASRSVALRDRCESGDRSDEYVAHVQAVLLRLLPTDKFFDERQAAISRKANQWTTEGDSIGIWSSEFLRELNSLIFYIRSSKIKHGIYGAALRDGKFPALDKIGLYALMGGDE